MAHYFLKRVFVAVLALTLALVENCPTVLSASLSAASSFHSVAQASQVVRPFVVSADPTQIIPFGTAFGYQNGESITLNTQAGAGCNRWGWYETPTLAELQTGSSGTLYVGVSNDISNAENVGTWTAVASPTGGVTVTYILTPSYFLSTAYIDLACLPINNCNPGSYLFNSGALPNVPVYSTPTPLQYPTCAGGSQAYLIISAAINTITTTTPEPTTEAPTTAAPTTQAPGALGDPQFFGFQKQFFQFHGLADEVFNLISTPHLQVNGHFVYLSSGQCDYNNTVCFQHPGTYIDQLGFAFQSDRRITLVAGPHAVGMTVHLNDGDLIKHRGRFTFTHKDGTQVTIHVESHDRVTIRTEEFIITAINSDMFFNLETQMLNTHLLRMGSVRHSIHDHELCEQEALVDATKLTTDAINTTTAEHQHGRVEAALQKKYGGVQVPLHGLIGQTWRNALICGKHWIGNVIDYVASDLFASDYFFNYYHQAK